MMIERQILKEVDLLDFHSMDATVLPDFLDNGAFEMVTHDGKHIRAYCLPEIVDEPYILLKQHTMKLFLKY